MILPKNNQKSYGVLHTENYFSFIGFTKKVTSDEIQKIDIYLDDELIDTLLADKKLQKIEDIYDIDGFGFTYNLPKEYIGKEYTISFKNTETKDELLNSPYTLISKNHDIFNKAIFSYSLNNIDINKVENVFKKNAITIIFDDNITKENYTQYIKDLCFEFPQSTINLVSFIKDNKRIIQDTFSEYLKQINIISPYSIYELAQKTEIFLYTHVDQVDLYYKLLQYSNEIACLDIRYKKEFIKDYDNISKTHELFTNPAKYNLSEEEIVNYENSFTKVIYERAYHQVLNTQYKININDDGIKFYFFDRINLILNIKNYKKFLINNYFKILRS
jgi:hypothetical protein